MPSFYDGVKWDSLCKMPASKHYSLLPCFYDQVRGALLYFENSLENVKSVKSVIDATCHIGGDTLHFYSIYPNAHITAIDVDVTALKCLNTNIARLKLNMSRFSLIHYNSVSYLFKFMPKVDVIYFDPPWGGSTYLRKKKIRLTLSGLFMTDIVNYCLGNNIASKIILKTPRNFDYDHFFQEVNPTYQIKRRDIINHKKKIIAFSLVCISK